MKRIQTLTGLLLLLTTAGCGKDSDSDDTATGTAPENNSDAEWEELGEGSDDESSEKEDDWDDWGDKEDDTGKASGSCGEEVIEGEPCTGGWEETWCVDEDDVSWWCESGVWTSEK